MENGTKKKLILAVLQGDDYIETVEDLHRNGFFSTVLSSSGGFLKKRSVTLMIGVEESGLETALGIIRRWAGKRQQMTYSNLSISSGAPNPPVSTVPVQVSAGGAVVFVLDMDDMMKF